MRRLALLVGALVVPVLTAAPAHADADNVICVGGPAGVTCDANAASISSAITLANGNAVDDTIRVGPGTYTDGPYTLGAGARKIDLVGSGRDATTISLPAGGVQDYVRVESGRLADLTVTMNATGSVGDRGVVAFDGALVERVAVDGTTATDVTAMTMADSTLLDSSVLANPGDANSRGIYSDGDAIIADTVIQGGNTGFYASTAPDETETLSGVTVRAINQVISVDGGTINLTNALIDLGSTNAVGLAAVNLNAGVITKTINANHVTIVGGGPNSVGVLAQSSAPAAKQTSVVNLSNSIVRGPDTDIRVVAGNNGAQGGDSVAQVNASYSDWATQEVMPSANGSTVLSAPPSNLSNIDPQFVNAAMGDYRLRPTSPLVDAGNPGVFGPSFDLDGEPRVIDGDGDGTSVRDLGAYELQDRVAPQTVFSKKPKKKITAKKVRFKFTSEPNASFECKRDKKAYKPCTSPLSWKVKLGKHVLRVRAIDVWGNVDSTPAKYSFRRLPKPSGCTGEC